MLTTIFKYIEIQFLIMEEKNITRNERECLRGVFSRVRRDFIIGENITVTDVWRSRMEEGYSVEDFDF